MEIAGLPGKLKILRDLRRFSMGVVQKAACGVMLQSINLRVKKNLAKTNQYISIMHLFASI